MGRLTAYIWLSRCSPSTHIAHESMIESCYLMATSDIRERYVQYCNEVE